MMETGGTPRIRLLLFLLLLAVWSMVVYRIYTKYFSKKTLQPVSTSVQQHERQSDEDEPYQLIASYPDPFDIQGANNRESEDSVLMAAKNAQSAAGPQPTATPPPPVVFPPIEYQGFVRLKNGKAIAVVHLNGKTINWAPGEVIEHLTLLEIREDSVQISFQGQRQVFRKTLQ